MTVKADESNPDELLELGISLCRRARWREAIDPLQRAVGLDPSKAAAVQGTVSVAGFRALGRSLRVHHEGTPDDRVGAVRDLACNRASDLFRLRIQAQPSQNSRSGHFLALARFSSSSRGRVASPRRRSTAKDTEDTKEKPNGSTLVSFVSFVFD